MVLGRWVRQTAVMWGSAKAQLGAGSVTAAASSSSTRAPRPRLPSLLRILSPAARTKVAVRLVLVAWAAHYILVQGAKARLTMAPRTVAALKARTKRLAGAGREEKGREADAPGDGDADEEKKWAAGDEAAADKEAMAPHERVAEIVARCNQLHTRYWPTVLNHGLVQTALGDVHPDPLPLPRAVLRALGLELVPVARREQIMTKDGGRIFVDYMASGGAAGGGELPRDAPLLLLFPGNLGDSGAPYLPSLGRKVSAHRPGWRVAVRGATGGA